jgi:hypothetical protein
MLEEFRRIGGDALVEALVLARQRIAKGNSITKSDHVP